VLTLAARPRGFTLVELMIAGTIALVALSAVVTVYSATARHSTLQLQAAHLQQQVQGIAHLIGRDLRRAGYWHFDPAQHSPVENPFQNGENRLRSDASPDEGAASCILLAYDLDADGLVGVGQCRNGRCPPLADDDNVEQFGFRLRKGAMQARYGGTGLDCGAGHWQALNDPDIEITRLRFDLHAHCINLAQSEEPCQEALAQLIQRVVSIDIGARIRDRPETEIGLVHWIAVRNDRLLAGEP
jgi:prepilin-type N-terminal cleavage/methylation domain-containing protein